MKYGLILGLAALGLAGIATAPTPAHAVVYCKTAGVPQGCVVRPAAPAARAAVYCTRPGYPVGCVGAPAARATVYCTRPGYPAGCVAVCSHFNLQKVGLGGIRLDLAGQGRTEPYLAGLLGVLPREAEAEGQFCRRTKNLAAATLVHAENYVTS